MAKFWMLLLVSTLSFGTELLSLGIRTEFRYADMDHECYLPPLAETFTLAAELEDGQITRATLRKHFLKGYSQILELDKKEIEGIVPLNKSNEWILGSFTTSGRILEMLFWGGTDQGLDTCFPPEKLDTITPSSFTFDFDDIKSNKALFQGKTQSGKVYKIELSLTLDS